MPTVEDLVHPLSPTYRPVTDGEELATQRTRRWMEAQARTIAVRLKSDVVVNEVIFPIRREMGKDYFSGPAWERRRHAQRVAAIHDRFQAGEDLSSEELDLLF